jgi:hypothetical protein
MPRQVNEITPFDFCRNDPLAVLLLRITKQRLTVLLIIILFLYGPLFLGIGILISNLYTTKGVVFLSILDPKEIISLVFLGGVFVPGIWIYYLWQVTNISKIFKSFLENELINGQLKAYNSFLNTRAYRAFNKKSYFIFSLIILVTATIFWIQGIGPGSSDPFSFGMGQKWWYVNQYYFYCVWLPLVLINFYMICLIIIRQLCFIWCVNLLYKELRVDLKLFHPDKCNGLEFIGAFAIRTSLIIVVFSFSILYYVSYPQFYGQRANFDITAILSIIAYTLFGPALPFLTTWSTHTFMVKTRNNELEKIARQLRPLLSLMNINDYKEISDKISGLENKYALLEREYKAWPIRPLTATRFVFTAITPIIGTGVSYLVDILLKRI